MLAFIRRAVVALAFLLGTVAPLHAQAPGTTPTFYTFVDTAGVAAVPDSTDQYLTWIYAREGPTVPPASGILVMFDCEKQLVKRVAHIVYQRLGDSTYSGPTMYDSTGWVPVSVPPTFQLVCSIGAKHVADAFKQDSLDAQQGQGEMVMPPPVGLTPPGYVPTVPSLPRPDEIRKPKDLPKALQQPRTET